MDGGGWDRVDELRKELAEAKRLLHEFANDVHVGECRKDHHGNCQEHFVADPCLVAEAREFLKRV